MGPLFEAVPPGPTGAPPISVFPKFPGYVGIVRVVAGA